MATLADNVANWLGRVELVARGADEDRRDALRALDKGDPLEARMKALAVLDKAPGSPIGLALLVDACEQAWLDDEAVDALRRLCESAPWRGELWVRLGEMLERTGAPLEEVRRAYQKGLEPEMSPGPRRAALLHLTDIDLRTGDPWRASRWLDGLRIFSFAADVALRRLELGLAFGDRAMVASAREDLGEPDVLDGRATLATARAQGMFGEPGVLDLLLRAYVLDAPGAELALSSYVATVRDAVEVARVRQVLESDGRVNEPAFVLALALAEGRQEDAHRALEQIARAGDKTAARALYDIALERADHEALRAAVNALGASAPSDGVVLLKALELVEQDKGDEALDVLDELSMASEPASTFADGLREAVYRHRLQQGDEGLHRLLTTVRHAAASLDRLDLVSVGEALVVEQKRPLRVAVVGEFNAGKSTFINALIGADVAPTGILPTTAALHWLSWAPDSFARIVVAEGPDRIVSHEALKEALRALQAQKRRVQEVHICTPLERLKHIELLDTPGFNAPEADHIEAARRAVQEAHVALWVLDASQALKDSERLVLSKLADLGTPVQVLVNKCDRLEPDAVHGVLAYVTAGLADVGLRSMSPVAGFSARLALAARLGDCNARERSGWDAIEHLLTQQIVNHSKALRRAAVHRKAAALAAELEELAREMRSRRVGAAAGRASSGTDFREQASLLMSMDRQAAERVVARLKQAVQELEEDLRPLRVAGVDPLDLHVQGYTEARIIARLVEPTAEALLAEAGLETQCSATLRHAVWLVLRGAAAAVRAPLDPAQLVDWRVARACALAASDLLMQEGQGRREREEQAALWARIAAMRRALQAGLSDATVSGRVES